MPVVLSSQYLDRLCEARAYDGLVWISGVLCGSDQFRADIPNYGFPDPAFSVVERLAWFAQGLRSGAWTYFEATPSERQNAILTVLKQDTVHRDFPAQYAFGMENWRAPLSLQPLDGWLDANDEVNNDIAWQIISGNRELIQSLANC